MTNFDIFLSHNSRDKPAVERIALKLKQEGLEPWLDKWSLTAGRKWQDELVTGLRASSACAFFIGPNGVGDWASEELDVALDRAARDHVFRLFLVLLPGVPEPFDATSLPPFLNTRTWVDLRKGIEDARSFQLLINAIKGVAPGPETPIEARADICPYRGLQTFNEEHVEFFFGRNGDIQRLVEKLKATRFFAVLGPSGSGKSSVVRGGLIPKIRAGALPDSNTWTVRVLTPGSHPLTALAAHLLRLFPQDTMQKTLDQMTADPRTLHLACSLALAERPLSELVIWVIDQFEEVFTLCRDEQERKQFLDNLLYAASVPDGRSMVVLTMRADFYSRCAAYPALSALVASQQFLVSPMDLDGLRQAIEEPAWRVGLEFEEGLVATILDDVANEPGALPLLEHALLELWERRRGRMMTLEAYRETGGVHGALAKRADTVYAAFSAEQQEIVRRIMLRLTAPGEGTEDTRRRATITELVTSPGEAETVESVVRAMADARLLTVGADEQSGERLIDVSHEALIRSWPRLRKWIDEDRASLRLLRHVTEAAQEWQRLNRDEGVLYRGARLAQALEWREHHEAMLNELEREFLDASVAEKAREEKEQQERQQRELAQAQALAAEQKKRADDQARAATRQRRITWAMVGVSLLAVVLAVFAWINQQNAARQARIALSRELAAAAAHNGGELKVLLAREAVATTYSVDKTVTSEAAEILRNSVSPEPITLRFGHTESVKALAFSPDGNRLASASENLIKVCDTSSGNELLTLQNHSEDSVALAWSNDGARLLCAEGDKLRVLDSGSGVELPSSPVDEESIQNISRKEASRNISVPLNFDSKKEVLSPDGRWIAIISDTSVKVQNASTGDDLGTLAKSSGRVTVGFSPNGKRLVIISGAIGKSSVVKVWDTAALSSEPIARFDYADTVVRVAFSPDSNQIAILSEKRSSAYHERFRYLGHSSVKVIDILSNREVRTLPDQTKEISFLAFCSDGTRLVTANEENVQLWDAASGDDAGTFSGRHFVVFSPDGKRLASPGEGGAAEVYEISSGKQLTLPDQASIHLEGVAFSPDSKSLATAGSDEKIRVWDTGSGRNLLNIPSGHHSSINVLTYSPDGKMLVSGGEDATAKIFDATSGSEIRTLPGYSRVLCAAFSRDSARLIVGRHSSNEAAELWDLSSKEPLYTFANLSPVFGVSFSRDGQCAAIWTTSAGKGWDLVFPHGELFTFSESGGTTFGIAYSPDGKLIATEAQVWDCKGKPLFSIPATGSGPIGVVRFAFSPDSKRLATVGETFAKVWDLDSQKEPLMLDNTIKVTSLTFTTDGKFLLTISDDWTLRLHPLEIEDLMALAHKRVPRELSAEERQKYLHTK